MRETFNTAYIIAKREFAAYFATPLAAVFLTIFVALTGAFAFYIGGFFARGQANLDSFFAYHPWLYLLLVPAVAMRLWAARKEFIKAYELYTRICLAGLDKHPDILRLKEQLPLMASLQILARKVNAVSGLRYLVLDAFPDVRTVGGVLKELGLDPAIEVIATPENPTAEIADAAAVVTSKHPRREILVKQGFRPGLVFSESDLVRGIVV